MKSKAVFAITVLSVLLLVGCGKEEEYKIEGPKASDNPSVGAPVSAGGSPGSATLEGSSAPGGKGSAPAPRDRGR